MDHIRILGTETSSVILIPSNMGCESGIIFFKYLFIVWMNINNEHKLCRAFGRFLKDQKYIESVYTVHG